MKIHNNKTNLSAILASLIMGLVLVSPTVIIPNVDAESLPRHGGMLLLRYHNLKIKK